MGRKATILAMAGLPSQAHNSVPQRRSLSESARGHWKRSALWNRKGLSCETKPRQAILRQQFVKMFHLSSGGLLCAWLHVWCVNYWARANYSAIHRFTACDISNGLQDISYCNADCVDNNCRHEHIYRLQEHLHFSHERRSSGEVRILNKLKIICSLNFTSISLQNCCNRRFRILSHHDSWFQHKVLSVLSIFQDPEICWWN